jgi:hypothetical protein
VTDSNRQLDLFPTTNQRLKAKSQYFALILEKLIDLMMSGRVLTKDEALSLCRAPNDLKRMEAQATKFFAQSSERRSATENIFLRQTMAF